MIDSRIGKMSARNFHRLQVLTEGLSWPDLPTSLLEGDSIGGLVDEREYGGRILVLGKDAFYIKDEDGWKAIPLDSIVMVDHDTSRVGFPRLVRLLLSDGTTYCFISREIAGIQSVCNRRNNTWKKPQ